MSKVEQIEADIAALSRAEQEAVSQWLSEFGAKRLPAPPLTVDVAWLKSQPLNRAEQSADRYVREDRDSHD